MKSIATTFLVACLLVACETKKTSSPFDYNLAKSSINESINAWDKGWANKDVELSIKHYADSTDWTNAFGDRVQSKEELKNLLTTIFGLDFVMSGENDYGENEIIFLNDSIATVRSLNIRKNQQWPDGTKMDDRYVNHLRVYKNINGQWLIINHMISQAWPKNRPNDSLSVDN